MTPYKFNPIERAGWEQIWQSGNIPPRYQSDAAPNESVVEWVETIPPGGAVLDVGCGVGRHVIVHDPPPPAGRDCAEPGGSLA